MMRWLRCLALFLRLACVWPVPMPCRCDLAFGQNQTASCEAFLGVRGHSLANVCLRAKSQRPASAAGAARKRAPGNARAAHGAAAAVRVPRGWDESATAAGRCVHGGDPKPRREDRVPFHLHVHKSGGSLYCHIPLKDDGLRRTFRDPVSAEHRGCNMLGDGPSTVSKEPVSGVFANRGWCCADRFAHAAKWQPALMSRESFATGPPCPDYFLHTITLRNPLQRLVSHASFHRHTPAQVGRWINETVFAECWRGGESENYGLGVSDRPKAVVFPEAAAPEASRRRRLDSLPLAASGLGHAHARRPHPRGVSSFERDASGGLSSRPGASDAASRAAAAAAPAPGARPRVISRGPRGGLKRRSYPVPAWVATDGAGAQRCSDAAWPLLHGTAIYDNYHVRLLGGEAVYFKPLGAIDRFDLERAKRVLDAYEVLVLLEKFDEMAVQLEEVLGWRLYSGWKRDTRRTPSKRDFDPARHARLAKMNALDRELYAYASHRAANLTAVALDGKARRTAASGAAERQRRKTGRRAVKLEAFLDRSALF
ncbi:hypothetical protein M885DRAFT_530975 [Pelagophyceae sp. CCMP2097]|nr:hypothetical protein M885DRAFT_530975 [Pelagophyceae sp. CCMP2097]